MQAAKPTKLSVVIPTLNEAGNVGRLLDRLAASGVYETVVSDGGSTDGTQEIVRSHGSRLVEGEGGRGQQLRAGANATTGNALLFLHADVVPPLDLYGQISTALGAGFVGGNFRLRYPDGGVVGRWLELLAPLYRRLGRYYGDSGIFVRRDVYERIGGMPHVPVMEDVILARRLEAAGPTAYLPGPMVSSARRWRERPLRTFLLWGLLQGAFALGASPWQLVRFYKAHGS